MAAYECKGKLMKKNYKKKDTLLQSSFKNVPCKSILLFYRLNSKIFANIENFSKFPKH